MKRILLALLIVAVIISCRNKTGNTELPVPNTRVEDSAAEFFYPISDYIQSQIAYVDSTPLAIEKHTFVNNRRVDSIIIDRVAFRQLAADFYLPDINDAKLKPLYTETKFHDLTINTLTFSYNAKQSGMSLQQRDILLVPETQKVKTVLFRKQEQHGDTTVTINGMWTHNMNFQLNYIIEPADGPIQTKQIKIIWDRPMQASE